MTYLDQLLGGSGPAREGEFSPVSRYYPEMDYLLYLKEDCSYRADRVDGVLTLLWHPYREQLVGLRFAEHADGEAAESALDGLFDIGKQAHG